MPDTSEQTRPQVKRFVFNVIWSWAAVGFAILSGVFLSPYVIHRLGDERYGIWVLAFSFIDYFALVDLGFKSAVVKYTAQFRATGETGRLEELVSTALAYFTAAGAIVFVSSVTLSSNVTRLFKVPPRDISDFQFLTVTVGFGCALNVFFCAYTGVLEGYQRFDISSRIQIVNNAVRTLGTFTVVWAGLGLKAMGLCILAGQLITFGLIHFSVHRLLPGRVFSVRNATFSALRQMFHYGSRTLMANVSLIVVNQDAAALIGHFLSTTFVGYYSFPVRLIGYPMEMVSRLGVVTGSKAAELTAHGELTAIARLAVLVNRYCLMLFFVIPVYLAIFGRQLLQVWINANFAAHSAPLLPILGAGLVVGVAAQYNSSAILYGLARHGSLAGALAVEAVLSVAGLWYVIPRYGLLGAASVVAVLMIVSRGLYVPYKLSGYLGITYSSLLSGIYAKPLAVVTPVAVVAWLANRALGEPATWRMVLGSGAAMVIASGALIVAYGLEREHRRMVVAGILAWRRKLVNRSPDPARETTGC